MQILQAVGSQRYRGKEKQNNTFFKLYIKIHYIFKHVMTNHYTNTQVKTQIIYASLQLDHPQTWVNLVQQQWH